MDARRLKRGVFVLEALNALAATSFFYYFYFFTHRKFGFDDQANLLLAALVGLVYMPASMAGGRFAQRAGYFAALKLGFVLMLGALAAGWAAMDVAAAQIALMLVTTVGMCFVWPTLEALVSEGEDRAGLQRNVGIYNVVWAGCNALAYFGGGAMLERFGLHSLFALPLTIVCGQLVLTIWLARAARRLQAQGNPALCAAGEAEAEAEAAEEEVPVARPPKTGPAFLRMAWLANPFSYIAINTMVAMMPGVAQRLGLGTAMAGVCGSVWCFARLATFFGLWRWPGWHYRFRWLLAAFAGLAASFAVILLAPSLLVMMAAQAVFGMAIGLIYYSSLFYSMDVGETKGEHGGIHEAAIGLGNCVGPAVGAASLHFLHGSASGGALAVSVLLLGGLGALVGVWRTSAR